MRQCLLHRYVFYTWHFKHRYSIASAGSGLYHDIQAGYLILYFKSIDHTSTKQG